MKIFLSLVVIALWTGSQDVRAQNVFTIDESAIECIQVIGPAPELREMSRRVHAIHLNGIDSEIPVHAWVCLTSARAATSFYTAIYSIYRRRWGCETALQGARLRLARAYLAAGGDARGARGATRPTFDPGDADHFAAAASPVLRGLPAGQRG